MLLSPSSHFVLTFTDFRTLGHFSKLCESLLCHSDTAQFKARKKGVYLCITDLESFCVAEIRLVSTDPGTVKKYECGFQLKTTTDFTCKILLDSLSDVLKLCVRNKSLVDITTNKQGSLCVVNSQSQKQYLVKDASFRNRVFYKISSSVFDQVSPSVAKFSVPTAEFQRIVNTMAVLSGVDGGVGTCDISKNEESNVVIKFGVTGRCGNTATIEIVSNRSCLCVPIFQEPIDKVSTCFFITYLKRSQNILQGLNKDILLHVSQKGVLLISDVYCDMCVVVFVSDVSDVDVMSYR